MSRQKRPLGGLRDWGGLLSVLLALGVLSDGASAASWREAGATLADSGTADPSDSETDAQREDEPAPGPDEPAGRGVEPPSEGDDFGCPVRDRGPFPMLV